MRCWVCIFLFAKNTHQPCNLPDYYENGMSSKSHGFREKERESDADAWDFL